MGYYTNPPENCCLCRKPFQTIMFDARHTHDRVWGNFCPACFAGFNGRTGVGYGQEYHRQEDGRWLKVRG